MSLNDRSHGIGKHKQWHGEGRALVLADRMIISQGKQQLDEAVERVQGTSVVMIGCSGDPDALLVRFCRLLPVLFDVRRVPLAVQRRALVAFRAQQPREFVVGRPLARCALFGEGAVTRVPRVSLQTPRQRAARDRPRVPASGIALRGARVARSAAVELHGGRHTAV